jgi:hypothetical protein
MLFFFHAIHDARDMHGCNILMALRAEWHKSNYYPLQGQDCNYLSQSSNVIGRIALIKS